MASNKQSGRFLIFLAMALLAGCQTTAGKSTLAVKADEPAEEKAVVLPFPEAEAVPRELDKEIVFSYLAGEIGAHRGQFDEAYDQYMRAAMLAKDPYAAERATRIALHLKDTPKALRAAYRWVDLAANSLEARQVIGILLLQDGQIDQALQHYQALIRIAEAKGRDGFMLAAGTLSVDIAEGASLNLMRRLVSEYQENASAHYALAVVEASFAELKTAEASLLESIKLRPDWSKPRILLANVLARQNRHDEALQGLQGDVAEFPDDFALRMAYARLLVEREQYSRALQQFRWLRQQKSDDVDVLYAIGMLAMQEELWDEARSALQELRNSHAKADEATYFLGQIEELNNNKSLAIGLYASVREGRLRTDARLRQAQLLAEAGQMQEARDLLQQLRVLDKQRVEEIYITESQLLQDRGSSDEALAVYEKALSAIPDSVDLLYNRALFYAELERIPEMEADLLRVLKLKPEHADALNALGYTLADKTDRYQEAFGYILKAHKLEPDSPAILDSLGWVYYRLGDYAEALHYLRAAVARLRDSEISAHLAEVLWVAGEEDEARKIWTEALNLDPESEELRKIQKYFK